MLLNYFIISIRYILRNKIQSIIQIVSLTIGMAVMIQIGLYVDHELSYDKFNEKIDRIYRLEYGNIAGNSSAIGHQIRINLPEVEKVVRLVCREYIWTSNQKIKGSEPNQDSEFRMNILYSDSTLFSVFSFPLVEGDPQTALVNPNSVVLKESTARIMFGREDPVGKEIHLRLAPGLESLHTVTGIMTDINNFHLEFDLLVSMVSLNKSRLNQTRAPDQFLTYLLLPEPNDRNITIRNINSYFQGVKENFWYFDENLKFTLRPIEDIYFGRPVKNERGRIKHGNIILVQVLTAIAVFILILACINYVNISLLKSSSRYREVEIRKALGARKIQLITQNLIESFLIALGSFLVSITVVQILLPAFNELAMVRLAMEKLTQFENIILLITGVILLGLITGIYPAVNLSRTRSINPMKVKEGSGTKHVLLRRILLLLQFSITVILIISVFTILKQIRYMKSAELGFLKDLIISIPLNQVGLEERKALKNKLLENNNIIGVASGQSPGSKMDFFDWAFKYKDTVLYSYWSRADPDYFELLDIEIVEGRNFMWDSIGDYIFMRDMDHKTLMNQGAYNAVINETAMRKYNLESPIGTILETDHELRHRVVGVVEDIHFQSLHKEIEPIHYIWFGQSDPVHIKISPENIKGTIRYIRNEFKAIFPDKTFEYSFLDDSYDQQYKNDERLALIISNFAFVAILLGCLGLFGLSFFMSARRTKEIGIRKSLGALNSTIFILLSEEFITWVALSVIIACPIAWIIMNKWLQSFAYRTNISWWIFLLAAFIAFAISFITVAWHAWKTARTNPIQALRYE